MKRKSFLGGLIALAVIGTAVVNVSLGKEKVKFSDLTKANIEALAESEGGNPSDPCETKYHYFYETTQCDSGRIHTVSAIRWTCENFGQGGSCEIGHQLTETDCSGNVIYEYSTTDFSYTCFL